MFLRLLPLLLFLLLGTSPVIKPDIPKSGKDYAFLFYNTNFSKGWTALPDTDAETRKLATELRNNYNFEVKRYDNLDLAGLRAQLAQINRRPFGPNDQVLFYFSSHGYYQAGSDRGYLIPTDGPANWNFGQGWLSYDELREYLSANTAKHVLVGLDACHSGSFGKRTKGGPTALPWEKNADCETISRSSLQRKSRLYFSSGNKNQRTAAQSEFLSRWLQCLREQPLSGNYVVSKEHLKGYVNTVSTSTPENGTFVGHDEGGGFVFVHKTACAPKENLQLAADKAHWAGVQRDKTAVKANEHIQIYGRCSHYDAALLLLSGGVIQPRSPSTSLAENLPEGMVRVPGGTFQMGDTFGEGESDEKPVHTVTVSPFQMGRYEVTFAEYDRFTSASGKEETKADFGRGQQPVINVSWFDAISYSNWLSVEQGFDPVYALEDDTRQFTWKSGRFGMPLADDEAVVIDWNANGYRLPTEAEWEFAASYTNGSTKARFGNGKATLRPTEANFNGSADYKKSYSEVGEYRRKTTAVGSLNSPNTLGIHDLSGNVWEWCSDWYNDSYYDRSKGEKNPIGPPRGTFRVLRGGSWSINPDGCRAANRFRARPWFRYGHFGFRLVRSPRE